MEKGIIVEGFRESEKMYGIRYTTLIGDGNSSIFVSVRTGVSYIRLLGGEGGMCNHLVRNYSSKLHKIAKDTKTYHSEAGIVARKLLTTTNIKSIAQLARVIIKRHAQNSHPVPHEKVAEVRKQLRNSPRHIFGLHENCPIEFCPVKKGDVQKSSEKRKKGQLLVDSGMMVDILKAVDTIADKANTLHLDMTSNAAKLFMSLVSRGVGGKRKDFSKGGGYKKCQLAALAYNARGTSWHAFHLRQQALRSPGTPMKKLMARRLRACRQKSSRKRLNFGEAQSSVKWLVFSCTSDPVCGSSSQQPDMDTGIYDLKAKEFLQTLQLTADEA